MKSPKITLRIELKVFLFLQLLPSKVSKFRLPCCPNRIIGPMSFLRALEQNELSRINQNLSQLASSVL